MRASAWCLGAFFVALPVLAADQNLPSDVEVHDLHGPVHTVSTEVRRFQPASMPWDAWRVIDPVQNGLAEYDELGSQVKAGVFEEGRFDGLITQLERDGEGRVTKRTTVNGKGEPVGTDVFEFGPFGKTSQSVYAGTNLLYRTTYLYDAAGHQIESDSFDGTGRRQSHETTKYDEKGHKLEFRVESERGTSISSYNAVDGHATAYTELDPQGGLLVHATFSEEKVLTYWSRNAAPRGETGFIFTEKIGERAGEQRNYLSSGEYTTVQRTYTGTSGYLPAKIVLLGADGRPRAEADYVYEFDFHGSWIRRIVSLWTVETNQTATFEESVRTITYYPSQ